MDYSELVKSLRICANEKDCVGCKEATDLDESGIDKFCVKGDTKMVNEAADAIEELLHAAKKMHAWIFLNTGDEQKAYDECGLSDEMNAALGYGGKYEVKVKDNADD